MPEESKLENVVCPFCGCLCDDIILTIEKNRIVMNENGCAISKAKFLNHSTDRLTHPTLLIDDEERQVPLEEAVASAAGILAGSKRLLIYGLSSVENDAHREVYRIGELTGGVVDNTSSVCHGPTVIGTQESGEAHGSLAETRHRSDLVIYWGANPLYAHPRHVQRFVKAPGEYSTKREVWVVDVRKSVSAGVADRFIQIASGSDLEVISVIRAILRGHKLDVAEVGGLSCETLQELAGRMKAASYGVLFFGLGLSQSKGKHRNIDAAVRLIQDLNYYTRWNMLPMRGHFNVTGANKTSTWQTGYPFAVDFSRGYPRYQPGEYTAVDMLSRGDVDALLNVGADPVAHFPREALTTLSRIPIVNLDPKRNMTSMIAAVNIPTALSGIECDGAAVRMDGLPLYLRQVIDPPPGVLPDRDILRMILAELRRMKS